MTSELRRELERLFLTAGDRQTQGYYDRLRRAVSWGIAAQEHGEDCQVAFICYWTSLSAIAAGLSGSSSWVGDTTRHDDATIYETGSRYKLHIDRDLSELIRRMCRVDHSGMLQKALAGTESQANAIIRDAWSWPAYWDKGRSALIDQALAGAAKAARDARRTGQWRDYLHILLWRIKHWRNQVLHGGVTHRRSRSLESIGRCVDVLEKLVPTMIRMMGEDNAKPPTMSWPPIRHPRETSPLRIPIRHVSR
jgi:hypothetical protein